MDKYILALNCGSSSVKFNLFKLNQEGTLCPYLQGIAEEIGNPEKSRLKVVSGEEKLELNNPIPTHRDALIAVFKEFSRFGISSGNICSVGHRVVHGGDRYGKSVLIDQKVIDTIRELIPIAPLHNPPNLTGIEEAMRLLPGVPQVAVFDTAFHSSIPEYAFRYAVPEEWYTELGVRKYGFHGTSHMYVSKRAARLMDVPYDRFNCITAHLGNGCSITKIRNGKSVDTSMGFTPLQGVVMGTRSGDIDPALIPHVAGSLVKNKGMDEAEAYRKVIHALNRESGLKALANTNMMQEIRQNAVSGDESAGLVVDIYAYSVAKYIGSYWATLPSTHAIVFTAGLGENEGYVRKKILGFLENLHIEVDEQANSLRKQEVVIGRSCINPEAPLSVMVIPTDEEIVIGYDTLYLGYLNQPLPETYPFESE